MAMVVAVTMAEYPVSEKNSKFFALKVGQKKNPTK